MSEVVVEPAGATAVSLLAALHAACFEDAWSREFLARLLATPGAFALLAHRGRAGGPASGDPEPMGFALNRVAGPECELLSLGVRPELRRQGAGRALIAGVEQAAAGLGAAEIFLEVAEDNAGARALYLRCGFRLVGRRPGYYARSSARADALILSRHIRREM